MTKPTQEQIKKFWERCGFQFIEMYSKQDGNEILGYWRETPKTGDCYVSLPDLDLNNLFKYAVPKLQDKGHCTTIQSYECRGYLAFISESIFSQRGSDGYDPFYKRVSEHEDEDPALALFWAIWEVMQSEAYWRNR